MDPASFFIGVLRSFLRDQVRGGLRRRSRNRPPTDTERGPAQGVPPPRARPSGPPEVPAGGWREQLTGGWLTGTEDGATVELWTAFGPKVQFHGGFTDIGASDGTLVLTYVDGAVARTRYGVKLAEDIAGTLSRRFSLPRQVPVEKVSFPELEADPHPWNGRVVRARGQASVVAELRTFAGLWLNDGFGALPADLSQHLELVGLVRHSKTTRRYGPSGFYQGELVVFSARPLSED